MIAISATVALITPIVAASSVHSALGQITVKGYVAINGRIATTGGSVFPGDRVDTNNDSIAAISLIGGQQIVQAGRSALAVNEENGRVTVAILAGKSAMLSPANAPLQIEVGGVQVAPGSKGGVYEIQLNGQRLSVTSQKGDAVIITANRTIRVRQGMECEADLGTSTVAEREGASGMKTPIVKFTLISAALVSSAALAVILAEGSSGCSVSPSSIGKCQATP